MAAWPEFDEAQLQQWVNDAIHARTGRPAFIVNLREEYHRGWDTAFDLPWLGPVAADQKSCNLFVQYKLSEHVGQQGAQARDWGGPYFRFQIPAEKSNKQAIVVDLDYHQFDRLKELSARGFTVCYFTNSVVSESDLLSLHDSGQLLSSTPALEVSDVGGHHKYVSFTPSSHHFLLHSEAERVRRRSVEEVMDGQETRPRNSLEEVSSLLVPILLRVEREYARETRHTLAAALAAIDDREGDAPRVLRTALAVGTYLYRYLNTTWVRFEARSGLAGH